MVYFDYAAATPIESAVVEAMRPFYQDNFANPSSIHPEGLRAKASLDEASKIIAGFLHCQRDELVYTSCGTESNNLAVLGTAKAFKSRKRRIITSSIEHPSILNACLALEKDGFKVTYLPVDNNGLVTQTALERAITDDTFLISLHLANSEVGIIQPIAKLARYARKKGILFHTDACQATTFIELDVNKLGVDLLTLNGSKCYGPKGIGLLYIRSGSEIRPLFFGGGQQYSLRSGTENLPAIIGLAKALEIVSKRRYRDYQFCQKWRDYLQTKLTKYAHVKIQFSNTPRLPNYLSVTLKIRSGQSTDLASKNLPSRPVNPPISENQSWGASQLLDYFAKKGFSVSAGSACSSRSVGESKILANLGLPPGETNNTLRLTLGRYTSKSDCDKLIKAISELG